MPESRMCNHSTSCFLLRSLDIHPSVDYQSTILCDTVTIPLVLETTLETLVNLLCQFLQIPLLCFHTQIPWQGFITQTIVLCNDCLYVYMDWFSPTQSPLVKRVSLYTCYQVYPNDYKQPCYFCNQSSWLNALHHEYLNSEGNNNVCLLVFKDNRPSPVHYVLC